MFTFWDRLGNTLNRRQVPPWWGKASWTPKGSLADRAPTTDETFVPDAPPKA